MYRYFLFLKIHLSEINPLKTTLILLFERYIHCLNSFQVTRLSLDPLRAFSHDTDKIPCKTMNTKHFKLYWLQLLKVISAITERLVHPYTECSGVGWSLNISTVPWRAGFRLQYFLFPSRKRKIWSLNLSTGTRNVNSRNGSVAFDAKTRVRNA